MTIIVNGEEKDLEAIGANGIDWTRDLLADYDVLNYDEENEQYTMTEEDYKWWVPVIEKLNQVVELEEELDDEAREMYNRECWPCDYDDEVAEKLEWLKNHVS